MGIRRLLTLGTLLLCSLPLLAQQDIHVINTGAYKSLQRNALWAGVGPGHISNTYIFTPTQPDQGICFYFYNNDVAAHTFSFTLAETGDPNVTTFTGNTGRWTFIPGGNTVTVPATGVRTNFIKASGAAALALTVSGTSGNGNGTIVAVQTQNVCGSQATSPVFCNYSTTQTIASATTIKIVSNDAQPSAVHVCGYEVTVAGAGMTAGTGTFNTGTGATCGTGGAILTRLSFNAATAFRAGRDGGGNELWPNPNSEGGSLCYTDSGSTVGSQVTINYAVY